MHSVRVAVVGISHINCSWLCIPPVLARMNSSPGNGRKIVNEIDLSVHLVVYDHMNSNPENGCCVRKPLLVMLD